jgi:hypothetical protein
MGSRARNSSGRKAASRPVPSIRNRPTRIDRAKTELLNAMDGLDEAIAVVDSAARSFQHEQDQSGHATAAQNGAALRALALGVKLLKRAYVAMDDAVSEVSP